VSKRYKNAPKKLLLKKLEKRGKSLKNIEKYRKKTFVKIIRKKEKIIESKEAPVEIFRNPRYFIWTTSRRPSQEFREDRISH